MIMLWSKGSAILAPGCSGQRFLLIHVLFVFVATHFNIHFGAWHRSALAINRSGLGSTLVQRGIVGGGEGAGRVLKRVAKILRRIRLAGWQAGRWLTQKPGCQAKPSNRLSSNIGNSSNMQPQQQQQQLATTMEHRAPSTEHRTTLDMHMQRSFPGFAAHNQFERPSLASHWEPAKMQMTTATTPE